MSDPRFSIAILASAAGTRLVPAEVGGDAGTAAIADAIAAALAEP